MPGIILGTGTGATVMIIIIITKSVKTSAPLGAYILVRGGGKKHMRKQMYDVRS